MATTTNTKLAFTTLDVFTSTRYLGNPLAVVFIPAALRIATTQEIKQRIAREFNLSETVFLHLPIEAAAPTPVPTKIEIDIFTTTDELPFAGHPTIGSAYLILYHLGWDHVDTLVTKAGPIRIEKTEGVRGGGVRATIPHAVHIHRGTLGGVLEGTEGEGAEPAEVVGSIRPALSENSEIRTAELAAPVVSIVRGMTFCLVELPSLEHLAEVSTGKMLDFGQVRGLLLDEGEWGEGFVSRYYYVGMGTEGSGTSKNAEEEGEVKEWKIRSRMVEMACEDPATGSAACTLASYLAVRHAGSKVKRARFEITQGVEMGRKSDIVVDAAVKVSDESGGGEVAEIFLGGTAVVVMDGSVIV